MLKDADSYLLLLVDLQERNGEMTFPNFFQLIFRMLAERLDDFSIQGTSAGAIKTESEYYEAFKGVVSEIERRGMKLILLFDEFGTITGSDNFDAAFFSFLRSIANNYECAYVTTSRLRLQELCRDTDISESPFFNIFTPVPLGQFDEEEARCLIFGPAQQAGVPFDEREAQFVLFHAGRHPLFIQMACSALFDHKTQDGASSREVDMEAVKAEFLVEANEQFEQIWSDMDEGKREVLSQIALGADITSQQRYIADRLGRSGYLMDDPPAPFSEAFAEFLVSKNPDAAAIMRVAGIRREPVKRNSLASRVKRFFGRGD